MFNDEKTDEAQAPQEQSQDPQGPQIIVFRDPESGEVQIAVKGYGSNPPSPSEMALTMKVAIAKLELFEFEMAMQFQREQVRKQQLLVPRADLSGLRL